MKNLLKIVCCLTILITCFGCQKIQPPTFIEELGSVSGGIQVGITSNVTNSKTYYTIDGTVPTANSDYFTDGVEVVLFDKPGIHIVKACTSLNDKKFSEVVSKTVTVHQEQEIPEFEYLQNNTAYISNYDSSKNYLIGANGIEKKDVLDFSHHNIKKDFVFFLTPEYNGKTVTAEIVGKPGYANSRQASIEFLYELSADGIELVSSLVNEMGVQITYTTGNTNATLNSQIEYNDGTLSEIKQGNDVLVPWNTKRLILFLSIGDDIKSEQISTDIDFSDLLEAPEVETELKKDGFLVSLIASEDNEDLISLDQFDVYYTTDGTDPRTSTSAIKYTSPFTLTKGSVVKACQKYADLVSDVTEEEIEYDIQKPQIDYKLTKQGFSVSLTPGIDKQKRAKADYFSLYYTTDGTDPKTSTSAIKYTSPFTLTKGSVVKACQKYADLVSDVTEEEIKYEIQKPQIDYILTKQGFSVSLTPSIDEQKKAKAEYFSLYYTTDGTDPRTSSSAIKYTSPFTLTKGSVVKACQKYVSLVSDVVEINLSNYKLSPPAIKYTKKYEEGRYYSFESQYSNLDYPIYYTIDGSEPNTNSLKYNPNNNDGLVCLYDISLVKVKIITSFAESSTTEHYDFTVKAIAGPAGGYVFYDCDDDNLKGNEDGLISTECGWRFLEVAPEDIGEAVWGYYRKSPRGDNLKIGTEAKKGTGKANTEKIVKAFGDNAYVKDSGTETTNNYAAALCYNYELNGYDDWFLPSSEELWLVYTNVYKPGFCSSIGKSSYWSSSETSYYAGFAMSLSFYSGYRNQSNCDKVYYVRPIRAF